METVINQHGLDIEALKSSRLPLTGGPQIGNYACLPNAERIFVIFFYVILISLFDNLCRFFFTVNECYKRFQSEFG